MVREEYRLVRRIAEPGETPGYGIFRVTYENGLHGPRPVAISAAPAVCLGQSLEEVRVVLQALLEAARKPILDEATVSPSRPQAFDWPAYRWRAGIECGLSADEWMHFLGELRQSLGRDLTVYDVVRRSSTELNSRLRDEFRWDEPGAAVARAWRLRRVSELFDRGRNPALYSTITAEQRDAVLAGLRFNLGREPDLEEILAATRRKGSPLYQELRWTDEESVLADQWRLFHATDLLNGVEAVDPAGAYERIG